METDLLKESNINASKQRNMWTTLNKGSDEVKTCIDVAVTHCMSGMLAFSVALAEEVVSQAACFGEGAVVERIAEVHHLVGREEGLVTSLVSLTELLRGQS